MLDFKALWDRALSFEQFVVEATRQQTVWEGIYRHAPVPAWAIQAAQGHERRLLVLAEDWCGDASNTVPAIARMAATVPGFELRILRRDEHPEVMDRYLTGNSRSIPIVIVLDAGFHELGHWGPRPDVLQRWVLENKPKLSSQDFQVEKRKWYARDRGQTALREVLAVAGIEIPAAA